MRDWFRILIMFSVCQFGTAPETGKHADATFDAGVVVLLKHELASQAQCADNSITLSYADQRHHEFILERSGDVMDLGVDLQFQHDLCAADIDAHRRAQGTAPSILRSKRRRNTMALRPVQRQPLDLPKFNGLTAYVGIPILRDL